jgi:hypothetical protein
MKLIGSVDGETAPGAEIKIQNGETAPGPKAKQPIKNVKTS